jgi:hypothetical protein
MRQLGPSVVPGLQAKRLLHGGVGNANPGWRQWSLTNYLNRPMAERVGGLLRRIRANLPQHDII